MVEKSTLSGAMLSPALLPDFLLVCVNNMVDETIECDLCVCVEVLRPGQPNGVMSSAVSLPNHTFTGQT